MFLRVLLKSDHGTISHSTSGHAEARRLFRSYSERPNVDVTIFNLEGIDVTSDIMDIGDAPVTP